MNAPAELTEFIPEVTPPPKQQKFFLAYCILSIFVLAGLGIVGFCIVTLWNARASLSWPSCDGTVTHSEVGYNDSKSIPTIHYEYVVDGIQYTGKRYCFGDFDSSAFGSAKRIVDELSVGSTVTVFYSPATPEKSVLVPGHSKNVYYGIGFGLVYALFAVGFMLLYRFFGNRDKTKLTRPYQASEPDFRG